jgi:DNA-binding NtrC family response regulator
MSKRILVVEDQPDNRQIIRDMLAPTDYEITKAENGEQALTHVASVINHSRTARLKKRGTGIASLDYCAAKVIACKRSFCSSLSLLSKSCRAT